MRFVPIIFAPAAAILTCSAPVAAQSFDGPFIGAQAGWESSQVQNPVLDTGPVTIDVDQQAFTGGIFVGYDKQIAPRIVVGVEGSFDVSADDAIVGSNAAGLLKIDPEWSIDLTGRAGYLIDTKTLAYVRGGYTNARYETGHSTTLTDLTDSENRDGWLAGAGVERQLLPNLSARLEYRYSDLSDSGDTWDRHRVLTGISYRF